MAIWGFVAQWVISAAVTYLAGTLFRKDEPVKKDAPRSLDETQIPTIDEGQAIPVVFGTVKISRPNIIWYGDFTNSGAGPQGYYYYLSLDLAFCHGPIDSLNKVYWGDFPVTTGYGETLTVSGSTVTVSDTYTLPLDRGTDTVTGLALWNPALFGGAEREGGTGGGGDIYWGTTSTPSYIPAYGASGLTVPYHRGIFRLWLPAWYLGTQPQPKPIAVEVARFPTGLTGSDYYPYINDDANPIEIAYEILTNTVWGCGMSSSYIDSTSWGAAAVTVKNEGLGMSFLLDGQEEVGSVLDDIMRVVDGIIYSDPTTGKLKIKLIRDDYTVSAIPSFDESSIISFECSTPWYGETINEVVVLFTDRDAEYRERPARAQDLANQQIQGQVISSSERFRGVMRAPVAQLLAGRSLRSASAPMMRCTFQTTRIAWDLKPGDPFKVSWAEAGVSSKVMRLVKINYGTLEDGTITIEGVEDSFALATGIYSYPGGPPSGGFDTLANVDRPFITYAPNEVREPGSGEWLIAMAKSPSNVKLWIQNDAPSDPFLDSGISWPGTFQGLCQTSVDRTSALTDIAPSGILVDVDQPFPWGTDYDIPDFVIARGDTLFCIIGATGYGDRSTTEWFTFGRVEKVSDTQYKLLKVNRMMAQSEVPQTITANSTRFYFPGFQFNVGGVGGSIVIPIGQSAAVLGPYRDQTIDHSLKFQAYNALSSQDVAGLTGYSVAETMIPLTPPGPSVVMVNDLLYPTSIALGLGGDLYVGILGYPRAKYANTLIPAGTWLGNFDSNMKWEGYVTTSYDGHVTPRIAVDNLTYPYVSGSIAAAYLPNRGNIRFKFRTYWEYIDESQATQRVYGPDYTNWWTSGITYY